MKAPTLFLLFLLLALLVIPAAAQDETPLFVTNTPEEGSTSVTEESPVVTAEAPVIVVDEPEVPVSIVKDLLNGVIGQFQTMSNVQFGMIAVLLTVVVLPTIYVLYNSNPAFRNTIKTAALEGVTIVEKEVEKRRDEAALNDDEWDDPIWKGLYEAVKQGRVKIENLGVEQPPQPPVITGVG